jgi:hypothetical protein
VVIEGAKRAKGSLSVVVRNDTAIPFSGPVNVAVLASTDAIADVDDPTLAMSSKPLKLKVGQSKPVKLKLQLASIPTGSYQLLGVATAAASQLTSSAVGPALSVQTPVVHLVSGGAPPPLKKPISAGKKVALSVPLRNDGNVATAKSPTTYTLVFSTTAAESGAVFQTTTTAKISLKSHQSKPQKVNFTLPAGALSAGAYTLLLKLSADLNDTNGQVLSTTPAIVA